MNPLMSKWKGVFLGIAYTGIFIQEYSGIFTMNLAGGRMDGTDDGHTALQTVFLVTS